jgi:CelD/BcsL family acetyltransferase involved in cellulose biosynthesis
VGVLAAKLVSVGRQLGIDAYDFINLPALWQDRPNPLVPPSARPNPSDAYSLALGPEAEPTFRRVLSKDARKKLRQKERWLAALGPVTHRVAGSEAEVDRTLDAYFRQKAARIQALGLPLDTESREMRAFVRQGCLAGLAAAAPAIELHALEVGARIVATFGLAGDRRRACGMFISFDAADDVARCSPGDLLVARVITAQCERGRAAFDLGVGEARYKSAFCDRTDQLFTAIHPVTARGRLYAGAIRGLTEAKRSIKRSPWAWRAIGRLRAARARLGV